MFRPCEDPKAQQCHEDHIEAVVMNLCQYPMIIYGVVAAINYLYLYLYYNI
jgi:hypothetical protein